MRRHHVTKLLGEPSQPFFFRNGVTASVSPFCMSTMVPYWSKASALISRFEDLGTFHGCSHALALGRAETVANQLMRWVQLSGGVSFAHLAKSIVTCAVMSAIE